MAEHDDPAETDGADTVLHEHGDVRRRFVELWNVRTSGEAGTLALDAAWQPIARLLDGHLSTDDGVAQSVMDKQDNAESPKETNDAP